MFNFLLMLLVLFLLVGTLSGDSCLSELLIKEIESIPFCVRAAFISRHDIMFNETAFISIQSIFFQRVSAHNFLQVYYKAFSPGICQVVKMSLAYHYSFKLRHSRHVTNLECPYQFMS